MVSGSIAVEGFPQALDHEEQFAKFRQRAILGKPITFTSIFIWTSRTWGSFSFPTCDLAERTSTTGGGRSGEQADDDRDQQESTVEIECQPMADRSNGGS
jgi:hypothetical protein